MAFAALSIDLNARLAKFEQDMTRAAARIETFGNKATLAATAAKSAFAVLGTGLGVAGVAAFAKSGIDAADALNDLSDRTVVSVKTLASFSLAAKQADTSLEDVGKGISKLTRSIGEAENGNTAMQKALAELGVTARDPTEAFYQLADGVERVTDPSQRAVLLNTVLGKSYMELMPLLNQGGRALRESALASETFAESMARLAPDAGRLNDSLDALKQSSAGAAAALLEKMVPGLADTATEVEKLLRDDKGIQAFSRGLAGLAKIPFDLAIGDGGIKIDPAAAERVKELEVQLSKMQTRLSIVRELGRFSYGLLGDPKQLERDITITQNQIAVLNKFGDGLFKRKQDEQKKDENETIKYGASLQEALGKAFDTRKLDEFTQQFSQQRKRIANEYAALREAFSGAELGPASSLDVTASLAAGRRALEGGDADGAQRAIEQAKSRFNTVAAQEGTASFEKSFLLREMQKLETDLVDASESAAQKMRESIDAQLAQLNADAPSLEVAVDASEITRQITDAIKAARDQLAQDPLRVPIVGIPSIAPDGRQSVDISRAALQYGRRR